MLTEETLKKATFVRDGDAVHEVLRPADPPFLDGGNLFSAIAGISPITHGPDAKGAQPVEEAVPVAELVRVAQVYALTAIAFGASSDGATTSEDRLRP